MFIYCISPGKEERKKSFVLQGESKQERMYLEQKNQPSDKHSPVIGSPKPKGTQSPVVQEWENGVRERTDRHTLSHLPSLPPHKFKFSHKALVSNSKHGVTFVFLLLNNLSASLICFLHLHKSSWTTCIYNYLLFLGLLTVLSMRMVPSLLLSTQELELKGESVHSNIAA